MSSELTKNEAASSVISAFTEAFRNYFNFKGRTCRYDYWGFTLVNFLVGLLLSVVGKVDSSVTYVPTIYAWLALIPGVSIFARRLHDVNKSFIKWGVLPLALFILLTFVIRFFEPGDLGIFILVFASLSIIGWFVALIVFTCRKGNPESNKYGEPIVESQSQDKKAKWLIFFLCVLPIVLSTCVLIVGGVSGYNKAMQRYNTIQSGSDVNQTQQINVDVNDANAQ